MPEGIEIEIYRRSAEAVVGRRVARVDAPDAWFLKNGTTAAELEATVAGQRIEAARRKGKLLVLDLSSGARLGLRFGMTGRLLVDDQGAIEYLEYSSTRNDPVWDRFVLHFDDPAGSDLRIRDPRRLGGVELEPDEASLGDDVFSISPRRLRERVAVGQVAIKARMLDQARVAGIGNLIADEVLWRASIDPAKSAGALTDAELQRLHRHLRKVLADFLRDGGSHTGRLQPARQRGASCPKDGHPLLRRKIGGRTTYSCTHHQS